MAYPNNFMRKKRSSIIFVIAPSANYIVFDSRIPKQKATKNRRRFVARVKFKKDGRDFNKMMEYIREWYEEINDQELLKRLEGAPFGNMPVLIFDDKFLMDFNSSTKDIVEEFLGESILSPLQHPS